MHNKLTSHRYIFFNHEISFQELINIHYQHDAEIMFWETKARVQERNMETIMKEITRFEILSLQNEEQVQSLKDIEEESAVVSAESEALRQETTSLRQDLVKCEAELSQCKAKIKYGSNFHLS